MYANSVIKQLVPIATLLFYIAARTATTNVYDSSVDSHQGGEFKCQPLNTPFCNIDSYFTVQPFSNTLGHTNLDTAIAELHKYAYLFTREACKSKIQLFLCSLYAPVCATSPNNNSTNPSSPSNSPPIQTFLPLLLPCRDDCEEARKVCSHDLLMTKQSWPDEWDCKKFNYHKDDKLCVIDDTPKNSNRSLSQPPAAGPVLGKPDVIIDPKLPYSSSSFDSLLHDNESIEPMCTEGLFDCRLRDPSRNMGALCIDPNFVCDGKKDCSINSVDDGLDEVGCEKKCTEEQHYCDGKCISRADICNGKVDCSSGSDELNCYDYLTGAIQLGIMLCTFALFSIVFFAPKFRCSRVSDDQESDDSTIKEDHMAKPPPCYEPVTKNLVMKPHSHLSHSSIVHPPDEIIIQHNPIQRFPIYNEPTYSGARSDYERLNVGGYSGASSDYMSYCDERPLTTMDDFKKSKGPPPPTPSPPPPTPAPQPIYSTDSMIRADLYVNMISTHQLDL